MRAAIIGAGALGCVFAEGLSRAGHDVTLIDVDEALVATISTKGVTVEGPDGVRTGHPRVTTNPASLDPVDIVLVLVKAFHTRSALERASGLIADRAVVATLQNGIGAADIIGEFVDPDRIVQGVTYHGAMVLGPGHVRHTSNGLTAVGPYRGGGLGGASSVAELWESAGWGVQTTADVNTMVWQKLVLNAGNAFAALSGATNAEMVADDEIGAAVALTVREAVTVARALGHDIDPDESVRKLRRTLGQSGGGKASMLQDVEAGRMTEHRYISGAIVAAGRRAGIPTPRNETLDAMMAMRARTMREARVAR